MSPFIIRNRPTSCPHHLFPHHKSPVRPAFTPSAQFDIDQAVPQHTVASLTLDSAHLPPSRSCRQAEPANHQAPGCESDSSTRLSCPCRPSRSRSLLSPSSVARKNSKEEEVLKRYSSSSVVFLLASHLCMVGLPYRLLKPQFIVRLITLPRHFGRDQGWKKGFHWTRHQQSTPLAQFISLPLLTVASIAKPRPPPRNQSINLHFRPFFRCTVDQTATYAAVLDLHRNYSPGYLTPDLIDSSCRPYLSFSPFHNVWTLHQDRAGRLWQ